MDYNSYHLVNLLFLFTKTQRGISFLCLCLSYWRKEDVANNPYGTFVHKLYIKFRLSSYSKQKKNGTLFPRLKKHIHKLR